MTKYCDATKRSIVPQLSTEIDGRSLFLGQENDQALGLYTYVLPVPGVPTAAQPG